MVTVSVYQVADPKDAVLVTSGESDDLAKIVFGSGRTFTTVVAEKRNLESVKERARHTCDAAVSFGLFVASTKQAPVVI